MPCSKMKGVAARLDSFRSRLTGWRAQATINCAILTVASAALVSCSVVAALRNDGKIINLYSGECNGSPISRVNTGLHLLINVISTLVLGSSNFFMQILNAPSREEADEAHSKGSWLGIGIPSVRNAFLVSKSKTWYWLCLFLTSIPIHLVFNSTVFETNYNGSLYHLTIATEDFLGGEPYYPPGASLIIPITRTNIYNSHGSTVLGSYGGIGYGDPDVSQYEQPDSAILSSISRAADIASTWTRIEPERCWNLYLQEDGLIDFGDVVMIVSQAGGWIRDDMWELTANQSRYWDQYVPANESNHLFFDATCMVRTSGGGIRENTCQDAFGANANQTLGWTGDYVSSGVVFPPEGRFSFITAYWADMLKGTAPSTLGQWYYNLTGAPAGSELGFTSGALNLSMEYCLSEPSHKTCHVGLSPLLLITVTAFIVAKTLFAWIVTVILTRRSHRAFVTLGDAIASYIEKPDRYTVGLCTYDQTSIKTVFKSNRTSLPEPHRWEARRPRKLDAVPWSVWTTSYVLFAISIIIAIYYMAKEGSYLDESSFLPSGSNQAMPEKFTLNEAVLLANSPQLLMSFCYLAYNNLFTRMQVAKEWASMSIAYRPLRVTFPEGEQISTYRLQLPYRYSLPLMTLSVGLHWLLSNTIYVFISTGGYYNDLSIGDSSLPPDTGIGIRYSLAALLCLIVVSVILVTIPILLGRRHLPPGSISPGSNSLALSAACHASSLSIGPKHGEIAVGKMETSPHDRKASEMNLHQNPLMVHEMELGNESPEQNLRKLARKKVRWGVVRMAPEWYSEYARDEPVEHLGFGAGEHGVSPPVPGHIYA
ncbi:hypothetical protein F5Y15DRAFT_373244 [Xylariaceae sp. FL0016]|nr:hypothetical protein F5Y15DRAFT_373244 [Xylariaceae sp. FL0016]